MKKLGLIGGLGPESTLDYYQGIIDAFKPDYGDYGYPEILIDSVNLKEFLTLADSADWPGMARILSARFNRLREYGADFGAVASNTPHRVFQEIQDGTKLPLVSIVTETCIFIREQNIHSVCLLGTGFTMRSGFFARELEQFGITAVVPQNREIDYIHEKLMTEVELGIIRNSTKSGFIKIIERIKRESGVEGVVMGCTELPHIVSPADVDLEYVDTTRIHIDGIVKRIRDGR